MTPNGNGQQDHPRHGHSGGVGSNAFEKRLRTDLAARDERIAAEARRLLGMHDGIRWAVIREAQEQTARRGVDRASMLTLAAAAEIYPRRWVEVQR